MFISMYICLSIYIYIYVYIEFICVYKNTYTYMYAFHSTHNDLVVLWTNSVRQPFEAKAWRVTELTLLASWLHLLPGHGWA